MKLKILKKDQEKQRKQWQGKLLFLTSCKTSRRRWSFTREPASQRTCSAYAMCQSTTTNSPSSKITTEIKKH